MITDFEANYSPEIYTYDDDISLYFNCNQIPELKEVVPQYTQNDGGRIHFNLKSAVYKWYDQALQWIFS